MLPEKWFVTRDEKNYEVINEWSSKRKGSGHSASLRGKAYFFSDKAYSDRVDSLKGYTEITFEDFKQYVLNGPPKEMSYEIY